MDIANMEGGLVVGTGDLSELALGWCTYNGDHMSMYGVNAEVPKTLVSFVIKWVIKNRLQGPDEDQSSVLEQGHHLGAQGGVGIQTPRLGAGQTPPGRRRGFRGPVDPVRAGVMIEIGRASCRERV